MRDITAQLLCETSHNVSVEPELQPLSGEQFTHRTADVEDGACSDIKAEGFWGDRHQCSFFNVRVFNPLAKSNSQSSLDKYYEKHEQEKCRVYEQRIRQLERASFTPLVTSATRCMEEGLPSQLTED